MSSGLSQVALQSCVSCAAFVDLFRRLFISRWLLPLYSRLDYGNATLAGLQACLLNRLQTVFNAAARSIAGLRLSEHITNALASFYRLWAPERIKFKLAVIAYTELFTALHLSTCQTGCSTSLIWQLALHYHLRPPLPPMFLGFNQDPIMHQFTKFQQNGTIRGWVGAIYPFAIRAPFSVLDLTGSNF